MMLEILSPEQKLFSGEVESGTLPGTLCEFTVLKRHAPLISSLNQGEIKYRLKNGDEQRVAIRNGFVEVLKNHVSVCIEEV